MNQIRSTLAQRSKDAESVIARHGISAWLVFLCAMLMSFLAIYTLTLSGAAGQLSRNWEKTLTQSATLRISVVDDEILSDMAVANNILATTPGITSFEEIADDKQLALLAPWLGDNIPAELLSLPRIFSTTIDPDILDEEGLALRLQGELPNAIWDNHQRWRGPLLESAKRLRILSLFSAMIVAGSFMFLIFVSAEASIFSNSQSIALLRQIGAEDDWIIFGFLRKFVLRTVLGAIVGVGIGLIATSALLATRVQTSNIFDNVSITGIQIPRAIMIVVLAGALGYAATYFATNRYLKRIS